MIGAFILAAVVAVVILAAMIHTAFEADWSGSLIIAGVLVMLVIDGWMLWHFQFQPALQPN